MKTESKNKTGNRNSAQATLAQINAQIAELQSRRVTLAEPLKIRYTEMAQELGQMAGQIRELDSTWRPAPLKPRAVDKIREIVAANVAPMAEADILKAVDGAFTTWQTRNILKRKSQGPKAVFAVKDGKYTVKA